ncbi:MAG: hypothetical protein K6V97_03915 [Actinomycetia bacterium]|nr:hypothetical protein [Actinomycetes bacterium]
MALNDAAVHAIDMSVTGKQIPVGGILRALQEGKTGAVGGKSYAAGFDATALNALLAAQVHVTAQQTTSATAGTATTVTVSNVPVEPVLWVPINASGDVPPNIQSMSYNASTQTVTFTVASSIASQTYQILFI